MLKEFREFINRGNLVDISVAFVLGVAFAAALSALTEGVVTPLIGRIFRVEGLQDFVVGGDIQIGAFIAALLNFLVVAFVVFLVVKAYNAMKTRFEEPGPEEPSAEPDDVVLLREIRDELRNRSG